jgi:hypothetical protein
MINIKETVMRFYDEMATAANHRYKSWEHCYEYFNSNDVKFDADIAALHLAFYLASWGMYRGSTVLLQHDYKFLTPLIPILMEYQGKIDINADEYPKIILTLKDALSISDDENNQERHPTDTLVTKIIMGTLGVTPAYDKYFKDGLKISKSNITQKFGTKSLQGVQAFVASHKQELEAVQQQIQQSKESKVTYPLMKLVDMYFWQIGSGKNK